jgi:hypothetical protein
LTVACINRISFRRDFVFDLFQSGFRGGQEGSNGWRGRDGQESESPSNTSPSRVKNGGPEAAVGSL